MNNFDYDVLIVGSGAAGLTLALTLPESLKVAVLSKAELTEASTYYAQGGVAAVLDETDTTDSHIQDTLIAETDIFVKNRRLTRNIAQYFL